MEKNKCDHISERTLLAYLEEHSKIWAPTTLWSKSSMLKKMLLLKNNIDITKYPSVVPYLKSKSDGYTAKKAKTFEREELEKFVNEAPDDTYLRHKLALGFGLHGGLRCSEYVKLIHSDIRKKSAKSGDLFLVFVVEA